MISRPAPLALAAALLVAALAGCSPTPEPAPEPTSGFASEEEAFAAAEETYRAYVEALNQVDLSDPETFEDVYAWTTGELNASDRQTFSQWHAEGLKKSGQARVASILPGTADLESIEVTLDACYDVGGVDVVDKAGDSLVDETRPDTQSLVISFAGSGTTPTKLAITAIDPGDAGSEC